jgi:protein TonB
MEEFEMLLDDVLQEVANPEPVEDLKHRVMMQMEMSAAQASEPQGIDTHAMGIGLFETELKPESVLGSLWSSLRELVLPNNLPPLVLESRPVALVDRMAGGRSYRSTGWAVGAHALAILLILYLVKEHVPFAAPVKTMQVTELAVPPQAPPKANAMGGGGGQRGPTPVTKGTPPKFAEEQIVPPKAPPLEQPKIHVEPTLEVQRDVKMASSLPQIGVASSPLVGMSMGTGRVRDWGRAMVRGWGRGRAGILAADRSRLAVG